jgi:hypothetical protein
MKRRRPGRPDRYRMEALPGLEAQASPTTWSPAPLELAPPVQGLLALDGGVLGPLFNTPTQPTP